MTISKSVHSSRRPEGYLFLFLEDFLYYGFGDRDPAEWMLDLYELLRQDQRTISGVCKP
jgi:hypothetical protein